MSDTGGPAFPIPLQENQSWQGMAPCDGMTLRDYFAAKAMQGLLAQSEGGALFSPVEEGAAYAYSMVDAMLKARKA